MLPLLEEVVMHAEEFVLIPKRMFVSKQPTRTEILDNPIYKQKAAQLSLLQRNNPTDFESKEATEQETNKTNIVNKRKRRRTSSVDLKSELDDGSESVQSFFSDDGEIEPSLKKIQSDFDSIMSEVELMEENKIQRAEIILNKILSSETVSIEDQSGFLHIEDKPMRVKVSTFLYNLQQPTKKIDLAVHTNILHELKIPPHLVSNTHAKKVLNEVYSDEEKEEETEQTQGESEKQQRSEQSSGSQSKASGSKTAEPKNQTKQKDTAGDERKKMV